MSTNGKLPRGSGYCCCKRGLWYARFYGRTGERFMLNTGIRCDQPTEAERAAAKVKAERKLIEMVKDAAAPDYVPLKARNVKFEQLCDLLRAAGKRKNLRTAERLGTPERPRALQHLTERFAGWPALAITPAEINRFADDRIKAGARPASVNRDLSALKRMFSLATGAPPLGVVLLPTAPRIGLLDESNNVREGFVEPADFEVLLTELRQREAAVADIVEALFFSFLRKGNVLGMTWAMVVPEVEAGILVGGEMQLPGRVMKAKRPLMLPLTGRLLGVLQRRWAARVPSCPYVFHRDGHRITSFHGPWRAATTAIGQPHLVPHDLRRSGARTSIRSGVSEDVTMRMGAWRTRSMLSRYNVVDSNDLRDAQQKMTAAVAAAAPRKVVPLRKVES
jgi:integrase